MRQRLVDPGGEGRGCRALRRRIDHLDAEAAREGHRAVSAAVRERDVEIAEVGRQLGDVGERQLAGAGFDRAGEAGGVGRHEMALDADLGSQREGCGLGEADRDRPVGKGRPGHVHAVQQRLDRGDALRRHRHRQDAGLRTLRGEAEPEARIALAQIAQPDLDLVVAGRQVDRHLRRARQVALVGRHPEALLAVDREDRRTAGGERQADRPALGAKARAGAGLDAGGAEPEAREIDPVGAEREPPGGGLEGHDRLRVPVAEALGEDAPAGIFVGDEVLVLREEEAGVHVAGHPLERHVERLFVQPAEPPVIEAAAAAERPDQGVVHGRAHRASQPPSTGRIVPVT